MINRLHEMVARLRGALWHCLGQGVTMPGARVRSGARVIVTMGGRIVAAPGCTLADNALVHAEVGTIRLGRDAFIGTGSVIVALDSIEIGDFALIAEHVTIRDQDHVYGGDRPVQHSGFHTAPIRIGNNVWIGAKATITRGVTIGDNAVIGANSVVTKDVPAEAVAVGVPARVIRRIDR